MKHLSLCIFFFFMALDTHAQTNLRVRGVGVDIWNVGDSGPRLVYPKGTRTTWESRYHKPGKEHLWRDRPALLRNVDYATTPQAGEDGRRCSLDSFAADGNMNILIAVPTDDLRAPGWTKTDTSFDSSISRFTLYSYRYRAPGTWVAIPYFDPKTPTMIFANRGHLKFDNPMPISDMAEGVVIYKSSDEYNRGGYIVDPNLIILPNGAYIAGMKDRRFISKDKGLTWSQLNREDYQIEHASSFYHDRALYIIGDEDGGGNGAGAINRSTDGGKTWEGPVRLLDNFRNSPSHVITTKDRIWIAYENLPRPHTVNFLSAAVDSDLMDPDSWISTRRQDKVSTGNEVDMTISRHGWPIAMPKGGPPVQAESASKAAVLFDRHHFDLPLSDSKYSAVYDPISDMYWALTSYSPLKGNVRTGIALWRSRDLEHWEKARQVLQGTSTSFHGFNYPFMQIEGDDIIFVSRTAWENEMGQAQRWHDANMLTFHRIRNFRL